MTDTFVNDYSILRNISNKYDLSPITDWDFESFWSFGDVESNHVYYHPNLTHYAHKAFELFFYNQKLKLIHYSDLSREGEKAEGKRLKILGTSNRITFPVHALYQEMYKAMEAGEVFKMKILCIKLEKYKLGVICKVNNEKNILCASVIWLRSAIHLTDTTRKPIEIPDWFPFNHGTQ